MSKTPAFSYFNKNLILVLENFRESTNWKTFANHDFYRLTFTRLFTSQ